MASLRLRMASGARWTVSIRVVERVIGFVSTLVLARLLAPQDFGVVAMGTAIQGILSTLTEFGFTKAIIRMQRPQHAHYSTAFTLNAITSALVALALLVAIPLAQIWYDDARVAPVLVTLAAISLIGGIPEPRTRALRAGAGLSAVLPDRACPEALFIHHRRNLRTDLARLPRAARRDAAGCRGGDRVDLSTHAIPAAVHAVASP